MNLIEKVDKMKKLLSTLQYHRELLARAEKDAREILRDELEADPELGLQKSLDILEPQAIALSRKLKTDEMDRIANAKNKTLDQAQKKAVDLGLSLIDRPKVGFGSTEDRTVRIVAMGKKTKYGIPTLIWYKGGSWSDNSGVHYGESWLEMKWTYFEKYNGVDVLRQGRYTRDPEAKLPPTLLRSGKLTAPRLKEIESIIEKHIKGYKAMIAPWSHTIVYP